MAIETQKQGALTRIDHVIEQIENWSGRVSALLIFVCVVLITADIAARGIWRKSLVFADEFSAYLFVGIVFLGLAYTARGGAHIAVDLVVGRFAGLRKAISETVARVLALAYVTTLLWFSWRFVLSTIALGTRSATVMHTPMFVPQLLVLLGLAVFEFHLLAQVAKGFRAVFGWSKE